ncbi:hypothetical protein J6590_058208 [Homalodisca vitripennis]|nr:hypothetical protein J6590_058208 [Homalodisca vitripennis]
MAARRAITRFNGAVNSIAAKQPKQNLNGTWQGALRSKWSTEKNPRIILEDESDDGYVLHDTWMLEDDVWCCLTVSTYRSIVFGDMDQECGIELKDVSDDSLVFYLNTTSSPDC